MKSVYKFNFKADTETLSAIKVVKNENDKPNLLFLHGGGQADKYRTLYLAEKLLDENIDSLAFDHSGSGESSGEMNESSLEKRCKEAEEVLQLCSESELTVCGSSMGGYIALKMLEIDFDIKNLILFCPAVYDKEAFKMNFDEQFTNIIRQEESWKNSDVFELLKNFKGNLLIVIGEDDEVIPDGVIELLNKYSSNVNKKKIIKLKGVGHIVHKELTEKEGLADFVLENVVEIIPKKYL